MGKTLIKHSVNIQCSNRPKIQLSLTNRFTGMKIIEQFHKGTHSFTQIFLNEFKEIFSDRGVILLIFGAGLLYPLLYSAAYSNETVNNVPVAVVDQDQSRYSRLLQRMISSTEQVNVAAKVADLKEAEKLFYTGKVNGVILIESGFSKKIQKSETPAVSVYADAGYFMYYKQVLTGSKVAALTLGAGIELRRMQAQGNMAQEAMKNRSPIGFKSIALYNVSGGYGSYAMPAVLVLILQQVLLLGIGMIGGTQHEFRRDKNLMLTSLKNGGATALVLGRASAYFTIFIGMATFSLVLVYRWFNLPHKADLLSLYVFITPFLLASSFLGLTLANFFKHRETSILVLLFTSIPFVFLSGLSWPTIAMPPFWDGFAHIIPSSAAVRGMLKLNSAGIPFADVSNHWWELWLLAVIYFATAVGITKWRAVRWKMRTL